MVLNRRFILLIVLGFSFLFSLVFYAGNSRRYTRLSFMFYHELTGKIVTEDRFVLLKGTYNENAEKILEELFLGPHSVFNRKIVNFGLKHNHFVIRDGVAYLDLPLDFVLDFEDSNHTIEETVILIEKNLLTNINKINSVILTVDGYLLNNGPFPDELPQGA